MRNKTPWTKREKWTISTIFLIIGSLLLVSASRFALDGTPDLNLPVPVPRPNPNGFDLYVAAAKALVKTNPPVDAAWDPQPLEETNPPLAAQRYSAARKQKWLAANTRAFSIFALATKTPCMAPVNQTGSTPYTSFGKLREMARAKKAECHYFQMTGQPAKAMEASLDTIQMGEDIAKEGSLIAKLVGFAIVAIGQSAIDDSDMTINSLSASEAKAAVKRLAAIRAHAPTFASALHNDRRESLLEFSRISSKPGWRSNWDDAGGGGSLPLKQRLANRLVSRQEIVREINTKFEAMEAAAQGPYAVNATTRLVGPQYTNTISAESVFSGDLRYNQARENVGLNLLALRLALRAYWAEHGIYPASLDELSPSNLTSIPRDDFCGKPYHYKIAGSSYLLWSVGPDGVDDGGHPVQLRPGTRPSRVRRPVTVFQELKGDWVAGQNR